MLLIFPPVAKPCEPPAGVALLASALKSNAVDCRVYDANADGLLYLINSVTEVHAQDSWTRRALKHRAEIIRDLQDPKLYTNMDRYHQRVYDLNRLLTMSYDRNRFRITLSDYSDNKLSSVDSGDLLRSAVEFKENPFYTFFEERVRPPDRSLGPPMDWGFNVLSQPGPCQFCFGRVDPGKFCRQKTGHGGRFDLFMDEPARV